MTYEDPPELSRGLALAWGVAASPQRGPKREMSVERIVEAAVELADAEGLGAVSMAAVAAKLGFTPMSLYRYISAKDDLLLLMQEEVTGIPPESIQEGDGWRPRLRALFEAQVLIYLRHPWVVSLPISGAPITPSSSAWMDAGLDALSETSLTFDEQLSVVLAITGNARWYGMVLSGYADQSRSTGKSPEDVSADEAALFDRVISADQFPALRRAIEAGVFLSEADPFRFAVERLFDGVEAYITRVGSGEGREPAVPWIELDPAELSEDKRYREAQKNVRAAEKALADARKRERHARREALDRGQRR